MGRVFVVDLTERYPNTAFYFCRTCSTHTAAYFDYLEHEDAINDLWGSFRDVVNLVSVDTPETFVSEANGTITASKSFTVPTAVGTWGTNTSQLGFQIGDQILDADRMNAPQQ
ncbi:conserved hypothetical protein [Ricinus communis]|uniref:Uncharacterized protein n=1 Tax=Ricinus communis TaxID=3988 RepID=B9S8H9_RICCO|nr:conserved hypothetical protein [Ricinus communis]